MGYDNSKDYTNEFYGLSRPADYCRTYGMGYYGYEYEYEYEFFYKDLWVDLKNAAEADGFKLYCEDNMELSFEELYSVAEKDGFSRYSSDYGKRRQLATQNKYARYDETQTVEKLLMEGFADDFLKYDVIVGQGVMVIPNNSEVLERNQEEVLEIARRDCYRRYREKFDEIEITRLKAMAIEDDYRRYSYNYLYRKELAEQDGLSKYNDEHNLDIEALRIIAEADAYKKYSQFSSEFDVEKRKEDAEIDHFNRYLEVDELELIELKKKALADNCMRYYLDYYGVKKKAKEDGFQRYQHHEQGKKDNIIELEVIAEKDHYIRYDNSYETRMQMAIDDGLSRYCSSCMNEIELKKRAIGDNYDRYDDIFYVARIRATLDFYKKYYWNGVSVVEASSVAAMDSYIRYLSIPLESAAMNDDYSRYFGLIEERDLVFSDYDKREVAKKIAAEDRYSRYWYYLKPYFMYEHHDYVELLKNEFVERKKRAEEDLYSRYLCNISEQKLTEEEQTIVARKVAEKDNFRKYELIVDRRIIKEIIQGYTRYVTDNTGDGEGGK